MGSNFLGIDREREYFNTKAAAQAGVGAEVIDYRPDLGILLLSFLDGLTMTNDDFQRPGIIAQGRSRRSSAPRRAAVQGALRHVRDDSPHT